MDTSVKQAVLLEGVSDVAAVSALAKVLDVDLDGTELVDLGGVTNVRRELTLLHHSEPEIPVLGLCDVGEARFVQQALVEIGRPVRDVSDLPAYGFFVCEADLEEELIRALGTDRVVEVIAELGLDVKLATLRQQPAWQARPLAEQLHRFCGVASGRKELLAGALAAALDADTAPEPLRQLLERIAG